MAQQNNDNDNNDINDTFNAADNVLEKFETMVNDYQQTSQQLNDVIASNHKNITDAVDYHQTAFQFETEEYPPPQPRSPPNADDEAKTDTNAAEEDVGGFAPAKHYCSHIHSALSIPKDLTKFPDISQTPECDVKDCTETENWICLKCHKVFCGRYGKAHMIEHYQVATKGKHCIAMGIGDLSFWCYKCDDYLHHLSIKPVFEIYKIVHQIKFGKPIPKSLEKETDFGYDDYYDYNNNDDDDNDEDEEDEDKAQEIIGRDPNSNPLTNSGANKGLGHVESGKDTVLEEDQTEYFDSDEVLLKKAKKMAQLIMISKQNGIVFHTGAGVSTSANLPDYRGPNGVWTKKAKGQRIDSSTLNDIESVSPTYTHMALLTLQQHKLLNYVVTTNVDGLHRKSGIHHDKLAELHGSIYMEYCNNCGQCYYRDYNVQKMQQSIASVATVFTRFTGRFCENEKCQKNKKGKLRDSIISFGESLPGNELYTSMDEAGKADLNVVMGSSMRVQPACTIPFRMSGDSKGYVVLINLQKTPYDGNVTLRVWGKCDEFMKMVMDELKLNVKPFQDNNSNDNNDNDENDQ